MLKCLDGWQPFDTVLAIAWTLGVAGLAGNNFPDHVTVEGVISVFLLWLSPLFFFAIVEPASRWASRGFMWAMQSSLAAPATLPENPDFLRGVTCAQCATVLASGAKYCHSCGSAVFSGRRPESGVTNGDDFPDALAGFPSEQS